MKYGKIFTLALTLAVVSAFAFAFAADVSSAADIDKGSKDVSSSGFTDMSDGTFHIYLTNNTGSDVEILVIIYNTDGSEKDSGTFTVPAAAEDYDVKMKFGYGSSGDKMVYYSVFSSDKRVTYIDHEGGFIIEVSHSVWKNTSTYVLIVVVVIAVIVVAFLIVRARANKNKAASGSKTFTEMHAERQAKKAGKVAEKQTYNADGGKKKRE